MSYKHTGKTVSEIGRELGVDYILEGSVRRENGRARVSAQLIRVSDQTHLWAQNYDRQLEDLLDVESDLGRAIAEQVKSNLTPQRKLELSQIHTVNPEAYDLYLEGRFYWNQRTPESIRKSVDLFQQAVAKDSQFALAYSGLADAYNIGTIIGPFSSEEGYTKARAAAEKAILLDPSLAEAHAALGMEKSHYEFDLPGAKAEFLKAIDLNPSSAMAHFFYSNCYLLPMGRTADAIAENKKALGLDPLSLPINNFLAMTYMYTGDDARAYQQFEHTIAIDPDFPLAHQYLSGFLIFSGRIEEGIKEQEKFEVLTGFPPNEAAAEAAKMLRAFKSGGEKGFWQQRLAVDLRGAGEHGAEGYPYSFACEYAEVGNKDRAFELLEKSFEKREGEGLMLVAREPALRSLHGDPRFIHLLRRLGVPENE
jgi:tetratricopeptide (TPR) repeat protein